MGLAPNGTRPLGRGPIHHGLNIKDIELISLVFTRSPNPLWSILMDSPTPLLAPGGYRPRLIASAAMVKGYGES